MTGTASTPTPNQSEYSPISLALQKFQSSISEDGNRFLFSFGEKRNLKLVSHVELNHQPFKDTLCSPKRLPCHIQRGQKRVIVPFPSFFSTRGLGMLDAYLLLPQGPGGRPESDIISKHGFTDNFLPSRITLLQSSKH